MKRITFESDLPVGYAIDGPIQVVDPGGDFSGPASIRALDVSAQLGCIRCHDAPCQRFTDAEINAVSPLQVSFAPQRDVCPVNAIEVSTDGVPAVDSDACVGCGLCIRRCPVGAISLGGGEVAVVSSVLHPAAIPISSRADFEASRQALESVIKDAGRGDLSTMPGIADRWARFKGALSTSGDPRRMFSLFVRNTFLVLGYGARIGNPGDTSMRMELVAWSDDTVAIGEIETGRDLLDGTRRLLADLAVVRNRFSPDGRRLIGFISCEGLPNRRVDYYELVTDIASRLGLKILTVPGAALQVLLDLRVEHLFEALEEIAIDSSETDVGSKLSTHQGITLPAGLGLRPEK